MGLNIVKKYFDLTFNKHQPELAAKLYLHDEYQHHDLTGGQTKEEFIAFFSQFFSEHPEFKAEIVMGIEENKMVVLKVETCTHMVAEFYQMEDYKIVNHWHVMEKKV